MNLDNDLNNLLSHSFNEVMRDVKLKRILQESAKKYYPSFCLSCPGIAKHVFILLKNNINLESKTNIMATEKKCNYRFKKIEGRTSYYSFRPHNNNKVYSNDNLTDEMAEMLIEKYPSQMNLMLEKISSHEEIEPLSLPIEETGANEGGANEGGANEGGTDTDPYADLTDKEIAKIFEEKTGQPAGNKQRKTLIAGIEKAD